MSLLFWFGFGVLFLCSVTFRQIIFHPFKSLYYGTTDSYYFFKHKKFNECVVGQIICFSGLFGKGKTLSMVHHAIAKYYLKKHDKMVWCRDRKKFVTQKIKLVSNVELIGYPYEKFISLNQLVRVAETQKEYDYANDIRTVTVMLGDEFSVQLNSRKFKDNIDPLFLNTLLTCRHHHMMLLYTAQRFKQVDALLRQVTSYVVECCKTWRVMVSEKYDAWDLENATNISMVKPLRRYGWFIRNVDYNSYDTLACVQNLSKSCADGDMLSEQEILALQCNNPSDMDGVTHVSRKWKRRNQKRSLL